LFSLLLLLSLVELLSFVLVAWKSGFTHICITDPNIENLCKRFPKPEENSAVNFVLSVVRIGETVSEQPRWRPRFIKDFLMKCYQPCIRYLGSVAEQLPSITIVSWFWPQIAISPPAQPENPLPAEPALPEAESDREPAPAQEVPSRSLEEEAAVDALVAAKAA
jgi:hypothetical protein